MPTVRTAMQLLLESTTKSVESATHDVICQFCTVKGMVAESEVLKAQSCALSKLSLPVHSNEDLMFKQDNALVHKRLPMSNCYLYEFRKQAENGQSRRHI